MYSRIAEIPFLIFPFPVSVVVFKSNCCLNSFSPHSRHNGDTQTIIFNPKFISTKYNRLP